MILSFIGLGALLKTSETLYTTLRLLGFSYLIYLGIKSFLDAHQAKTTSPKKHLFKKKKPLKMDSC
ncbi:LysE family transporter [Streptococcus alactolyticus]|uniref:LysE family transporter n=1 Tax=Streptococcus alactolyticus TaxID=29389 RepID=UPI001F104CB7|nr:LysE family transporter [Streptococcus alactolyticus]